MKIGVITVSLNACETIERAIQSVLGQNVKDVEYWIIDGGSADGTLAKVEKFRPQITGVVSEPDKGISDAMNKGIAKCQTDIIAILHADDWLEPQTLNKVVDAFAEFQVDIVYGNIKSWRNGKVEYIAKADHRQLWKEMTLNHPATFVKRSVYESLGGFNDNYRCAMDYEFLLRASLSGVKFHYLNEPLTNMSMGGISDRNWLLGCKEVFAAKRLHGKSLFGSALWFGRQVIVIMVVKLISGSSFEFILKQYRKKYAKVRKV